jgi:hypothetical protein
MPSHIDDPAQAQTYGNNPTLHLRKDEKKKALLYPGDDQFIGLAPPIVNFHA